MKNCLCVFENNISRKQTKIMNISNKDNSSDNPSLYRYISFEKAISLFTNGFYVPIAKSFEDLNECKIKHLPNYLAGDIESRVEDCFKKIKELSHDTSNSINSANLAAQYKECFGEFFDETDTKEISCRPWESIFGIISSAVSDYGKTHAIVGFPSKSIRCCSIAFRMPQNDEESKSKLRRLFENLAKEDLKGALISCWTKNPKESYVLWRSYAEKKGIRIKTNKGKLEKFLKSKSAGTGDWPEDKKDFFFSGEFSIKSEDVTYLTEDELRKELEANSLRDIKTRKELLEKVSFLKSDVYRSEEEFRVLLYGDAWESGKLTGIVSPQIGVSFPLGDNPGVLLDEIMLSPFLSEFERESYMRLFSKLFPGVPLCRSKIEIKI